MSSAHTIRSIQDNIALIIKGKAHVIEMAVVCLLARGHLLLEDVLGSSVDVGTRRGLHPTIRAHVEKTAIQVF